MRLLYWWILFFPMKKIDSMLFDFIHLLKLFLLLNMNVKIIFFVNLIWVWSPLALIARKTAALFFYGSCFISPWNAGFLTWRPGVLWLFTLMFWKYCTLKFCRVVDHQLWIYTSCRQKGCDFQRKCTHGRYRSFWLPIYILQWVIFIFIFLMMRIMQ